MHRHSKPLTLGHAGGTDAVMCIYVSKSLGRSITAQSSSFPHSALPSYLFSTFLLPSLQHQAFVFVFLTHPDCF